MVDKVERHDLLSSLLKPIDHGLDLETLSENEIISMSYILHLLLSMLIHDVPKAIFMSSFLLDMRFVTYTCISHFFDSEIKMTSLVRRQHML